MPADAPTTRHEFPRITSPHRRQVRSGHVVGLARLGEQVTINLPGYRESVELSSPGENVRTVSVKGRQLAVRADEIGTHQVTFDKTTYSFGINALSRDESDLRKRETGQWGDWIDDTTLRLEYRPIAWILLLLVLGLVALHLWLVSRAAHATSGRETHS